MYCTIDDIINDLTEKTAAQLSNDTNPDVVNAELIGRYITDAGQLVDGFLRSRYPLPLMNNHAVLKKVTIDLVKYELYKRRGKVYEDIQSLHKDAIATLDKLQKGMITLDEGTPETRPGFFKVSNKKPVFPRKMLDSY